LKTVNAFPKKREFPLNHGCFLRQASSLIISVSNCFFVLNYQQKFHGGEAYFAGNFKFASEMIDLPMEEWQQR
jgi:hypothetical protein